RREVTMRGNSKETSANVRGVARMPPNRTVGLNHLPITKPADNLKLPKSKLSPGMSSEITIGSGEKPNSLSTSHTAMVSASFILFPYQPGCEQSILGLQTAKPKSISELVGPSIWATAWPVGRNHGGAARDLRPSQECYAATNSSEPCRRSGD